MKTIQSHTVYYILQLITSFLQSVQLSRVMSYYSFSFEGIQIYGPECSSMTCLQLL